MSGSILVKEVYPSGELTQAWWGLKAGSVVEVVGSNPAFVDQITKSTNSGTLKRK